MSISVLFQKGLPVRRRAWDIFQAIRFPVGEHRGHPVEFSSFVLFVNAIQRFKYTPSGAYDFCWMDFPDSVGFDPQYDDWIVAPSKSEFLDLASVLEVEGLYPHGLTRKLESHPLYRKFC